MASTHISAHRNGDIHMNVHMSVHTRVYPQTDRETEEQLFHQKPGLVSSNRVNSKFKAMGAAERHEIHRKCVALHWMCWGEGRARLDGSLSRRFAAEMLLWLLELFRRVSLISSYELEDIWGNGYNTSKLQIKKEEIKKKEMQNRREGGREGGGEADC